VPPLSGGTALPLTETLLGWKSSAGNPVLLDDQADNPYTVLENVMRLFDVTTTRSNVFAIWMTVGFFKVEKVEYDLPFRQRCPHIDSKDMFDAVYPDGYLLGKEMGLDDGTVKRYRAFYLIDRSVFAASSPPFVFERGKQQNTEDVILKQTLLESGRAQNRQFRDDATP
jgi:hypothetical protein